MRLAVYQCQPLPLDIEANLRRLERQAHAAAAAGARLLVCPEMFLSGYDIGRDAAARLAEPANGPSAQRVAALAQTCNIAILYGYPERSDSGQVFNAVQLIERDGQSLCNYRKTHLFGELDKAMFSPGDRPSPLVSLDGWMLGMLICYDLEFAENVRQLAVAGAELILVPTANMYPYEFVAEVTVRSRAFENQCCVVYANYCGHEGSLRYCGLSSIASPDGSVLARAEHTESLLIGELDRVDFARARKVNRYLQDLQPDLYKLAVKR